MHNFYRDLTHSLFANWNNRHYDNFDFEIREGTPLANQAIEMIDVQKRVDSFSSFSMLPSPPGNTYYMKHIDRFADLYASLSDEASQLKYIELLSYAILGFTRIKLSLNSETFWNYRKRSKALRKEEHIAIDFRLKKLYLFDLHPIGYDLSLFFIPNGITAAFLLEQYSYGNVVQVQEGDTVIDAGACWGDSALYFAHKGATQIYSFEFIPSNLDIMQKNLDLNPALAQSVTIVRAPLWHTPGQTMSYLDRGPASMVDAAGVHEHHVTTESIDHLVEREALKRVDFIKMDIEGAELDALKGAARTIRRFRPKLAISVYHKNDDFITIPAYLLALNGNYRFYLDYYTIIGHEIVLFAIDEDA